MAQMSLSDLQTQVKDWVPGQNNAQIARAGNLALRQLYAMVGPMVRWTLTTTAIYNTGTIAVAQGATAVTLTTGTFAAGTDGQLLQGEGEPTWYGFTRTAGSTGTLGSGFAGTTLTVGTYTLAYAFYDLPTTVSSVFNLWKDARTKLTRMGDEEYDRWMGSSQSPGIPRSYAIVKGTHASNSALRVQLIPYPDTVYTFTGAGRARATVFPNSSPTTEYSGLPEDYDNALVAGTLYYLTDQLQKQDRSAWWFGAWKDALRNARGLQTEGMDGQYGEPGTSRGPLWQRAVT